MVHRIAVIESNKRERASLEKKLSQKGYELVEHDLSADLLSRHLSMPFQFEVLAPLAEAHLIITESRLGELDGVTLIRLFKENKYTVRIPILVLSHDGHYNSVLACVKAGAGDYLVKPIDDATLTRRIALLLGEDWSSELGQGVESIMLNFQDYLIRELKRSERSKLSLSIILGRVGTPEEIEQSPKLIRAAKSDHIDERLSFFEGFISSLRNNVREYDTILRYGPQGLIAVLPMTEKEGAHLVEERFVDIFKSEVTAENLVELRRLELFTGVSAFPEEATSKHDLLTKAEERLTGHKSGLASRKKTKGQKEKQVFLKALFCPVCKTKFEMEKPRDQAFLVKDWESDFRPVYERGNPLYYAIPVCPKCFYSTFFVDFEGITETEILKLKKSRMARGRIARGIDYRAPRTLQSALASYRLAAECYQHRKVPPSTFARLYHRGAWLLREAGKRDEEKEMIEKALTYYERAYLKEDLKGKKLSDLEVTYLIGELSLRLGRSKRALECLGAVLRSPEKKTKKRLVQMAQNRYDDAKRAIHQGLS